MRYIFAKDEKVKVTAEWGDWARYKGHYATVVEGPLPGDDVYWVELDTKWQIKIHGRELFAV